MIKELFSTNVTGLEQILFLSELWNPPGIFPYASISKQILQNLKSVFKCIKLPRIRGHICEFLCQYPVFYMQVLIYRIIASTKIKLNLWVK